MPDDWSREEVEATLTDYFSMLESELRGESYNKSEHNRLLRNLLRNRSHGSVERKHQNISAILRDVRFPWIIGYKPLGNYQRLLADIVSERLDQERHLEELARALVERPATMPPIEELSFETPPKAERPGLYIRETPELTRRQYRARHIDYFERETRNRSLGSAGEELVVRIEQGRLIREKASALAEKVEWISKTAGDGAGFDVLSFDASGKERFIEVKTTTFGKETPFYASRNEVSFSSDFRAQYHLYRLFEFRDRPRLYTLPGALEESCRLEASAFVANVR